MGTDVGHRQAQECGSGLRAWVHSGDLGMGCEHRRAPGGTPRLGPAPPVSVPVELRAHLQDGRPEPEYQIRLCFGEEYPGPPDQPEERLLMAHVSHLLLLWRTTASRPLLRDPRCYF